MADYSSKPELKSSSEDGLVRKDPLAFARKMVLGDAEVWHKQYQDFEELIAVKGRELDLLCKARDVLGDALRGTEAIRVEITQELEGPKLEDTAHTHDPY